MYEKCIAGLCNVIWYWFCCAKLVGNNKYLQSMTSKKSVNYSGVETRNVCLVRHRKKVLSWFKKILTLSVIYFNMNINCNILIINELFIHISAGINYMYYIDLWPGNQNLFLSPKTMLTLSKYGFNW